MKKAIYVFPALALAFALAALQADAFGFSFGGHQSGVEVENVNEAEVINDVKAKSDTGDNEANWNSGDAEIVTGPARSSALSDTTANSNETVIDRPCRCKGKIEVKNYNGAGVLNEVEAEAETGDNEAKGNGGFVMFGLHSLNGNGHSYNRGETEIHTGSATAEAQSWTLLNSNVTRIR